MMADTDIGRMLTTKVISPIQSYDRGARSLEENRGLTSGERTLNAGQGVREKGGGKQESAQPKMIVIVGQWICLALGVVCIACGVWGISMKPEQAALSAYIAWLGSLYMPALRVTAVVCIGLGVMLARRGWAHL